MDWARTDGFEVVGVTVSSTGVEGGSVADEVDWVEAKRVARLALRVVLVSAHRLDDATRDAIEDDDGDGSGDCMQVKIFVRARRRATAGLVDWRPCDSRWLPPDRLSTLAPNLSPTSSLLRRPCQAKSHRLRIRRGYHLLRS